MNERQLFKRDKRKVAANDMELANRGPRTVFVEKRFGERKRSGMNERCLLLKDKTKGIANDMELALTSLTRGQLYAIMSP